MHNYEEAELVLIGAAEENILGIMNPGSDADLTGFPFPLQYMDDSSNAE